MVSEAGEKAVRETVNLWKAEFIKMRHMGFYLLHIFGAVIPSVIFLLYYTVAHWEMRSQITGFIETIGIAFPMMAGILCAKSVELEQSGHFQTFFGVSVWRGHAFLAKWMSLQSLAFAAVFSAVGIFAAGEILLLENTKISVSAYLVMAFFLWAGSIPLYAEHLFLSLKFSGTVSMGVSALETLIAALFVSKLGDGIWMFFPASFSARGSMMYVTDIYCHGTSGWYTAVQLRQMAVMCGLIGFAICAIIIVWFHFFEGRDYGD